MSEPITIVQDDAELPQKRSFRKPALIVGAAITAVTAVYLLARKTAPEGSIVSDTVE